MLVSEDEREAVQERKRMRIMDLHHNVDIDVYSIEEFKNSIILGKVRSHFNQSISSSSDSPPRLWTGSSVINHILSTLTAQDCPSSLQQTESSENSQCGAVDELRLHLRSRIVALLVLEQKTQKWYSYVCTPYIVQVCRRIDKTLDISQAVSKFIYSANSEVAKSGDLWSNCCEVVDREVGAWERAVLLGDALKEFQAAQQVLEMDEVTLKEISLFWRPTSHSLDADGFEVVTVMTSDNGSGNDNNNGNGNGATADGGNSDTDSN